MGGRGAKGVINDISVNRHIPGVPRNAITEDEYLAIRGVGSPVSDFLVDKMRGNRQLRTQQGMDRFNREAKQAREKYYEQREAARVEYKKLIAQGKVRDKTTIERSLTVAHGNPDNPAVQAARRMLGKRGIDWRTGKKKKRNI